MDFVAIDLGASNTRYVSTDRMVGFLSNRMAITDDIDRYIPLESYDAVPENNLDVTIIKEGESKFFPVRAIIGSLTDRCDMAVETPSQMSLKVDQRINYISTIMAAALSKLKNVPLGDTLNLFVALPPAEVVSHRDRFKQELIGKYTVRFNKLGTDGTTIKFTINNVACYEESRMALMQFFFDPRYPDRQKKYTGCDILSIDIGASTTDLVVFKNNRFLDKTGRTFKVGCNLARDYIIRTISESEGMDLPFEIADRCLAEGRLKQGNAYVDIGDIVDNAKKAVAKEITIKMDQYFTSIGIPIKTINYIVVSGGGSMESSYVDEETGNVIKTSAPMSVYLTDALKEISAGTEIVYYGDEPRLANINGLGTLAFARKGEIKE